MGDGVKRQCGNGARGQRVNELAKEDGCILIKQVQAVRFGMTLDLGMKGNMQ
jgi:hypothetical protein